VTDTIPTPGTADVEQFVRENVDTQADINKARSLTVGDTPMIQESVEPFVELPRGVMYAGTWQKRAMVRELTGVDEEAISRVKEVADIYDTVLALGTVRVGELELGTLPLMERQGHLAQLLLGERDQLFIGIVRMTYGDRKTMGYRCPSCGESQDLTVVLSEDFPVQSVPDVERTEFDFVTSKGDRIVFRPAIGADQIEALKRKNATMAEQNTVMLSRCMKRVNDDPVIVDPVLYARKLSMKDRQALLGELVSHQPKVDMNVTVNCVSCREEQMIPLGWADLFQP
jgi:hypothetical protein